MGFQYKVSMLKMKPFFLVLLLAATAFAETSKWLDFRVKYSASPFNIGRDSYIPIAKTMSEAKTIGWIKANTTNRIDGTTYCYSEKDNRICPIYDKNGFIAGMLLAIPVEDVEGHGIPYDFNSFKIYEKKTINDKMYWTSTYYLVDPNIIKNEGRTSAPTLGNGLWFQQTDGFIEVPTDLSTIENSTPYVKQNCIPQMGRHYYYNVTKNLPCEKFEPFFLLVKDGNIAGLGWQFFGKTTPVDKNWYDDIGELAVKATVPIRPDCLVDYTKKYGVISTHMYFVEKPWFIGCNPFTDSANIFSILGFK